MGKKINLENKKFGSWTVLKDDGVRQGGDVMWLCVCECGAKRRVRGMNLTSGKTKSCGCLAKEVRTKHGKSGRKEYYAWDNMISRCFNPKAAKYSNYGGRGITVCERWKSSFENFYKDMGAAPSERHSVDRIDSGGDYTPNNCRWATIEEQNQNTSKTILTPDIVVQIREGLGVSCSEWAKLLGTHYTTIFNARRGKTWSNI